MAVLSLNNLVRLYPKLLFHGFLIAAIYSFWITYASKSSGNAYSASQLLLYGLVYVAMVYGNMAYLFPRFFLKGRILLYLLFSLLSFIAGCLLMQWILYPDWFCFYSYILTREMFIESSAQFMKYSAFTGLGITYTLFMRWQDGEKKITTLKNINLNTELESLKKQISPHFLFNTLNNLYVLIKTEPKTAAETTLYLSELLRYQLYECSGERVPLQHEIDCVKGLVFIEQLRKKNWTFQVNIPPAIPDNIHIPPLTFVTLVENAIKHGSQKLERGTMDIKAAMKDRHILFIVTNSKPLDANVQHNEFSGIGLTNLKRRLSLLYPADQYRVSINVEPSEFSITLMLPYEMYNH
jgi:LytS/YehU family sensor histidine kinase